MPGSAARLIALSGLTVASSLTFGVTCVWAQSLVSRVSTSPRPVTVEASMRAGMVVGLVTDDRGSAVPGVAITAIGTTQALAKTDATGQFRLALVPGDYILRASREGYVSPYRESVRIRAAAHLERNITLTRQPDLTDRRRLLAGTGLSAGVGDPLPVDSVVTPSAKSESLQAWYLRHLPRTVLRDGADPRGLEPQERMNIRRLPSLIDWAVAESARAATSFFTDTDFTGQFNMLTTSALSPTATWDAQLPRGVAYLSVGAPVSTHGDWRVRGALSTGGLASWVALGEYEARDVQTHAFRIGMSYGAQRFSDSSSAAILTANEGVRTAASVYGFDRWQVNPTIELSYGLRADRYDYVSERNFLSPRIGLRVAVLPRTFVTALASSAVIAPGMDAFLPPPASGPWLPPDRTFAPLVANSAFTPERVQRFDIGVERSFGPIGRERTVAAHWFQEHTRNQLATMFGLDAGRDVGHYYVASAGDVTLQGWKVSASGWFTSRVKASVDYSLSQASWVYGPEAAAIAAVLPSALRPQQERLHDVTSSLHARIPESQTNIFLAYRINSAFTRPDATGLAPMFDGRFDVQIRQALPYQPIQGGRIEVLVAINNLFRDPATGGAFGGSFYDELLTVRAPRRVLGGVQVRF
jgi:hypothetical protein